MPVVEKIEKLYESEDKLGLNFSINNTHVTIDDFEDKVVVTINTETEGLSKIQAVFLAVIKFITFYNSQIA